MLRRCGLGSLSLKETRKHREPSEKTRRNAVSNTTTSSPTPKRKRNVLVKRRPQEERYVDATFGMDSGKCEVRCHGNLRCFANKFIRRFACGADFAASRHASTVGEASAAYVGEVVEAYENARGPHSAEAKPVGGPRRCALTLGVEQLGEEVKTIPERTQQDQMHGKLQSLRVPAWALYDALDRYTELESIVEEPTEEVPVVVPDITITPPDDQLPGTRCVTARSRRCRPLEVVIVDRDGVWKTTHFVDEREGLLAEPPRRRKNRRRSGDYEVVRMRH